MRIREIPRGIPESTSSTANVVNSHNYDYNDDIAPQEKYVDDIDEHIFICQGPIIGCFITEGGAHIEIKDSESNRVHCVFKKGENHVVIGDLCNVFFYKGNIIFHKHSS